MFYLSNRKIKLFIISILLIIFCFVLGIFDVKAAYTYELYELDKINLTYLTYAGDTPINAITDFNSLDYDKYTYYDTFYGHIKENVGTTEPYTGIKGYINSHNNAITYYSFIVYSPTQINSNNWVVCMTRTCSTNINENSVNSPQVTEIKLNTTSNNYFYIIGWYGLANNRDGLFTDYTFQWTNSDYINSLVTSTPNVYAISNLYSFNSLNERDEFIQSTSDYLSSVTEEDPELPDNPILSPYIDTSGWGSDIGGWGHSFDSSTSSITDLITMPITLLRAIINNASTTCSSYTLGSIYNVALVLPCITLSTYLGSTLTTTIDLLLAGLIIYHIGKKFVKIFDDFTNLRDNQINELYGGGK